jgi:hypothetical protein
MTRDEKKEVDPEGIPVSRKMSNQQDEASAGITPTSPTPLLAKPASYLVQSEAPGQPAAPAIGREAAPPAAQRAPEIGGDPRLSSLGLNISPERGNAIKEYVQPANRLPETIDASRDLSNPDGCAEGGWWRK